MKDLMKLKDKLWDELAEIAKQPELGTGDLEVAHKLTDTIKNIDKICALEDGMDGYSGARHWVRGHYSRDGRTVPEYMDGYGYARRRDSMGRYSREDGRDEMMSHLSAAMATSDEEDREMIRRLMDKMK